MNYTLTGDICKQEVVMIGRINDFLAGWTMTLIGGAFLLASFILPGAGFPWGKIWRGSVL